MQDKIKKLTPHKLSKETSQIYEDYSRDKINFNIFREKIRQAEYKQGIIDLKSEVKLLKQKLRKTQIERNKAIYKLDKNKQGIKLKRKY
ncbi:MAG: hypothetical protein HAW60_05970 [Bdellovibrionales bacterium]|nr:hypothetical protein [Bdellovibrionales bacterium]